MDALTKIMASVYYRLVYINKVKTIEEVPEKYREALEEYRKNKEETNKE